MLFQNVVGHSAEKERLIKSAQTGRVPHAQMFVGKEGGGNFQLAMAYAQYLNCATPTSDDACGVCSSCKQFGNFQHPDLHFFFPTATTKEIKEKPSSKALMKQWIEFLGKNEYFDLASWMQFIEIEQKQTLINKTDSQDIVKSIALKNYSAKYKIILIWWPEKMNIECSNKILKALEEPTPGTVFLLVGHQPEDLLATIISRVQITTLTELKAEEIAQALMDKRGVPDELAHSISKLAGGSYNEALELIDHPEGDEYFIDLFQTFMRLCYQVDMIQIDHWVEEVSSLGREKQKRFLEYCLRQFRACLMANYSGQDISDQLHFKEAGFMAKFAKFIHGGNILFFIEIFEHTHLSISRNGHAKIALMNMSLKVCNYLRYKPN